MPRSDHYEAPAGGGYGGQMLDLNRLDLEEIATALADQTDYEHRWLINPRDRGSRVLDVRYGIDGQTPVTSTSWTGLHRSAAVLHLVPGHGRLRRTGQRRAARRRLARAIQGKGAFRRFKDELHEEYPHLLPAWYAFRDSRASAARLSGWPTTRSSTTPHRTLPRRASRARPAITIRPATVT